MGLVTKEGFATLHEDATRIHSALAETYLLQQREFAQINKNLEKIVGNQQTSLQLRANERYDSALRHYRTRCYNKAIQEAQNALREQSTHLPSLLLLGNIRVRYGCWDDAKDTFYEVAEIALLDNNITAYEAAVQGLVHTELQVGNWDQALAFLAKSLKKPLGRKCWRLRKEYFRLHLLDLGKRGLVFTAKEWVEREFGKLSDRDDTFWETVIGDKKLQAMKDTLPILKYGPVLDLVDCVRLYQTDRTVKGTDFGHQIDGLANFLEELCDSKRDKQWRSVHHLENLKSLHRILRNFKWIQTGSSSTSAEKNGLFDHLKVYAPIGAVNHVLKHSASDGLYYPFGASVRAFDLHRRYLNEELTLDKCREAVEAYKDAGMSLAAINFAEKSGLTVTVAELYFEMGEYEKAIGKYERDGIRKIFYKTPKGKKFLQALFQKGAEKAISQGNNMQGAEWFAKAGLYERAADTLAPLIDEFHVDGKLAENDLHLDPNNAAKADKAISWYLAGNKIGKATEVAVKVGNLERAVELCLQAGWSERAAFLAESANLFDIAFDVYKRLGKDKDALRCAELAGKLKEAIELCDQNKWFEDGVRIAEKAGNAPAAINFYVSAGKIKEAAACAEKNALWKTAVNINAQLLRDYKKAGECAEKAGQMQEAVKYYLSAERHVDALRVAENNQLPSLVQQVRRSEVEFHSQRGNYLQAARLAWKHGLISAAIGHLKRGCYYLTAAEVAAQYGELGQTFFLLNQEVTRCVQQQDFVGAAYAAYRIGNITQAVQFYQQTAEYRRDPVLFLKQKRLLPRIERIVQEHENPLALLAC